MSLIFALVLGAAIIAVVVVIGQKRGAEQREQGLIAERDYGFVEKEYIYSSPVFDFDQLLDAIKQIDFETAVSGVGFNANRAQRVMEFSSPTYDFQAQLSSLEDKDGEHRFRYCFTHWSTHNGTPRHMGKMNLLMTAMEKSMLMLDPFVTVRSRYMKTKSKAKLL